LIYVATSILFMSTLAIAQCDLLFVSCRLFPGSRPCVVAAWTIEAGAIVNIRPIIDHCPINISIVDDGRVNSPDGGIIVEISALPSAANEPRSIIAEAIIDPTVESNVRSPIACVPAIPAPFETPPTGRPK
jgi:hypothetical protein